jgi:hypothetical protein
MLSILLLLTFGKVSRLAACPLHQNWRLNIRTFLFAQAYWHRVLEAGMGVNALLDQGYKEPNIYSKGYLLNLEVSK